MKALDLLHKRVVRRGPAGGGAVDDVGQQRLDGRCWPVAAEIAPAAWAMLIDGS
jgi:hypothetical protein